jgi:prepilin-type N-terminal cleavage/methylation domain-containing protein
MDISTVCMRQNKNNPPSPPFAKVGAHHIPPLEKGDTGGFSGEKGFTLIEVLIAMLVLAIGLLSLATLAGTVIRGNSFSNKMTTATTRAQERLEEVQGVGYANANSLDTAGNPESIDSYSRTTIVQSSSPAIGMKTVTVTVSWDADAHSVALKTILAE